MNPEYIIVPKPFAKSLISYHTELSTVTAFFEFFDACIYAEEKSNHKTSHNFKTYGLELLWLEEVWVQTIVRLRDTL